MDNDNKTTLKAKVATIFKQMLTIKSADELISASKHSELKKTLNAFDLKERLLSISITVERISLIASNC